MAVYLNLPARFQVPCFHTLFGSEGNKGRLINSWMVVNVAKWSQALTKVNAMLQSEKRGRKKEKEEGEGEDLGL